MLSIKQIMDLLLKYYTQYFLFVNAAVEKEENMFCFTGREIEHKSK